MIIPSELDGHKVVTIAKLVKDVYRFSPEYNEYLKKCDSIKKIVIHEGIIEIKDYILNFKNLNDVTLPSSIKIMGANSFNSTWKNSHKTSSGFIIYNGILIDGGSAADEVSIPSDIKCIADRAFYDNKNITSVKIPSSVKEMGRVAFGGSSIEKVIIPGSIKNIPREAFEQCKNLEKVILEDGVETIESIAFSGCSMISSIDFSASVKYIGTGAFRGCSKLETVKSNHKINVETGAFDGTKVDKIEITGAGDKNTKPEVQVGWHKDTDGKWYYYEKDGHKCTGWKFDNNYNSWFYLNSDGSMKTGWLYDNSYGSWFYLNPNGTMKTGWLNDRGTWYYLYSNGAMACNTWINQYYVNRSGAWTRTNKIL